MSGYHDKLRKGKKDMDKVKALLNRAIVAEIDAGKGKIIVQEPKELKDVDSDTEVNNAFKELCSCVEMLTVDETDYNIITESAIKYSVKYAMAWAHTAYSQGLMAGINAAVEADAKTREKMKAVKEIEREKTTDNRGRSKAGITRT